MSHDAPLPVVRTGLADDGQTVYLSLEDGEKTIAVGLDANTAARLAGDIMAKSRRARKAARKARGGS